jgi:alpha-tubulin suppressor-like RCC1 family protein
MHSNLIFAWLVVCTLAQFSHASDDDATCCDVVSLAAGDSQFCATVQDQSAVCWGRSNGWDEPAGSANAPIAGQKFVSISPGVEYGCAVLLDDNSTRCWGTVAKSAWGSDTAWGAVNLGTGLHATMVTAGEDHACAILNDGSVKCWGSNQYGQLGLDSAAYSMGPIASEMGDNLPPVFMGTGRTAKWLVAGAALHTCAILDDDSVKCWGYNDEGQLGDGGTTSIGGGANDMQTLGIVNLGAGRTAKSIDTHEKMTCAVLDDDTLMCWGDASATPTLFPLGAGRSAKSVSVGKRGSCVLLDDDTVKCWINSATSDLSAVVPLDLGGVAARGVAVGTDVSCVLLEGHDVRCWGSNYYGGLNLPIATWNHTEPFEATNVTQVCSSTCGHAPPSDPSVCLAGHWCAGGNPVNHQAPCLAGSFSLANATFCTPCSLGTYTPDDASSSCTSCPTGTSTNTRGAASLAHCIGCPTFTTR